MAIQRLEESPLLLFDEVGHGLDHSSMELFIGIIQQLANNTQIIMTSFSDKVLKLKNVELIEVQMEDQSKIKTIEKDRAIQILNNVNLDEDS